VQIDLLVIFDAAPQPLDEHVVTPGTLGIHADGDAVAGECADEGRFGELVPCSVLKMSGLRALPKPPSAPGAARSEHIGSFAFKLDLPHVI
jgi:hypothetical protein